MASNTLLESVAAFESQAKRAGLNEQWIEAFGRNDLNKLGRLAYAVTTPGVAPTTEQVTDFMNHLRLGVGPTLSEITAVKRVLFEAQTLTIASLRSTVHSPDDASTRRVAPAERSARIEAQRQRLQGLELSGPMEPSHWLYDQFSAMLETGELKYISPGKCMTRQQELSGDKPDKQIKLDETRSSLVVKDKPHDQETDITSDLSLLQAMTRRALAMDLVGIASYNTVMKFVNRLFALLTQLPAPGFGRPGHAQLLRADKLAETIQHSLQSAGCEPENAEQSAKMLPGRTRISESQLKIDAALCTYFAREFFAKSIGHLYLWADSSPQGGTDWLLSMLRIVPQEQLEPSAAAARRLQASVQDFQLAVSNKDFALSMEIAERRHEDGVFLSKAIALHRQIPLGLGSGDSSLEKKMLCIFRKVLAETQDFKLARKALRKVVCVCTDMGTEGGLSLAQGLKLTELCPAWVSDANAGLVSEDDWVNLAGGDSDSDNDESSEYFLPNSIPSPGLLHIFHNMAKDVHMKLNGFDSWVVGFKAIAALLHYKHLRNRLVATCVLGTPWEWLRGKFDTAAPKPALWRWNTITQILPKMLSLKFLLQKIWRADKFAQLFSEQNEAEGDGAEREPQDPDFKMQAVTEAIESEAWWMYTAMLQKLGSFSEDLSAWAESCSCHSWLRRTSAETAVSEDMGSAGAEVASEVSPGQYLEAARKTFGFSTGEGDGQAFECPLAGQRASGAR